MSILEQLTERQRAIYDFIRDKIVNRGYGPTVREIGTEFQISSPNGVMCHLKALEKKGLIKRSPNKSRAIELARGVAGNDEPGLPLEGTSYLLIEIPSGSYQGMILDSITAV